MSSVYHPGELEVQKRAGAREMAERIGSSIGATIPLAAREFLRSQPMAVIGTLDAVGRVWASLVTGEAGFIQAVDERTVRIETRPVPGDPLGDNLTINGPIGLLVIDFTTRRRMRVNGTLELHADGAMYIRTEQVYANCPKYIQARAWERRNQTGDVPGVQRGGGLTCKQRQWISSADTFFLASSHPQAGVDASHRGGNPGFVRVTPGGSLVWPDYPGNKMFQTLGNIAANPRSGLLFVDFDYGGTLQLTGRARIVWNAEAAREFVGAERVVEFDVDEVVEIAGVTFLAWRLLDNSPVNPG